MGLFVRTPFERIEKNLIYFIECSILKKERKKRFAEIGHCKYWIIDDKMEKEYINLRKEYTFLPAQLLYADYIYNQFEENFGAHEDVETCIFDKYHEHLRDDVVKVGNTLHAICHSPLELIQYRSIGLQIKNKQIDLEKIKKFEFCRIEKNIGTCIRTEEELAGDCRFILRKEQFLKQYFEINSMRNILSQEIKIHNKQASTLKGTMLAISTLGVSLFFGRINIPFLLYFAPILLVLIIWYISTSIKLNVAKDVMFFCLGLDIDNPECSSTHE